jgi:hypothetical protein
MTGFDDKKATARGVGADPEPSMTRLDNGGILHPIHRRSRRTTQGEAIILEQRRTGIKGRLYLLAVVVAFFISQICNFRRMVLYQQKHLRWLKFPAYSTYTYTTNRIRSTGKSLEPFVVPEDLFRNNYNNHSKVVPNNKEETFELDNLGDEIRCGGRKYLFRLKSNQHVGYLMAHEGAGYRDHIDYEFNQTLHYGPWQSVCNTITTLRYVSTLLLEPPRLDYYWFGTRISTYFLHLLNARLATVDQNKRIRISTERALVVQKSKCLAPAPNMLWKIMWWLVHSVVARSKRAYAFFLCLGDGRQKGGSFALCVAT